VRIKKELEALKVPSPTGKKKWPVKTIENILTNEKYTGTSVYGETESADFPQDEEAGYSSIGSSLWRNRYVLSVIHHDGEDVNIKVEVKVVLQP
jgi:hypothetical protein